MNTSSAYPVARKEHQCSTCARTIRPGERYRRSRCWDGAEAWVFRQCQHCERVSDMYDPRDSDDLISMEAFGWWLEDPPRDVTEARAMAGWRHKWTTQTGALWPLPERPLKTDPPPIPEYLDHV